MVRRVDSSCGEVPKEGAVGRGALDPGDVLDGAVRDVSRKVVVVLAQAGLHRVKSFRVATW